MPPNKTGSSRRVIDGVLLLDKPIGLSSNHALQAAKRFLNAEKAGHTGTLDPLATGLLPLCFGESTKFSQTLLDADKSYRATIRLGQRTDTCDAEGAVIAESPVNVTHLQFQDVLAKFLGPIQQIPPMHSALKLNGRALYDYARRGEVVERAARSITIHRIHLVSFDENSAVVDVDCTKGTYIRTLADDIGQTLGCGAHLAGLRRTRIGRFHLDEAVTLSELEVASIADRDALLQPVDALLAGAPMWELSANQASAICQGKALEVTSCSSQPDGDYRLYQGALFFGLARLHGGKLVPVRLINTQRFA